MLENLLKWLVEEGSYGAMFAWIMAAGLGAPLPEDIALIAGGVQVQRGATQLIPTVLVLAGSVLLGDSVMFFLGKKYGTKLYSWHVVQKMLPESRRLWIERMIAKYGGLVVFCARHVAGLRAPTFVVSAVHGIPYWKFILFDALGMVVSLPIFMYIGYWSSDKLSVALAQAGSAQRYILGGVIALVLIFVLIKVWLMRKKTASSSSC